MQGFRKAEANRARLPSANGFENSGGWIRTSDLLVMSQARFYFSTPRQLTSLQVSCSRGNINVTTKRCQCSKRHIVIIVVMDLGFFSGSALGVLRFEGKAEELPPFPFLEPT